MRLKEPLYAAIAAAAWCANKVGAAGSSALSSALATASNAISSKELPQPTPGAIYVNGRGVEVRPELLENPSNETLQAAAEIQKSWRQERDLEQLKDRIHQGTKVKRQMDCLNQPPPSYRYTNTAGVERSVDCNDLDYIYSPDAATRPTVAVISQNIKYFVASDTYYETRYRDEDCSIFGWGWAHCTRAYEHAVTTYRVGERGVGYRADYVPDTTAQYRKTACQAAAPFVVQREIGYNPNVQYVTDKSISTNDFTRACAAAIDSCVAIQEFVCQPRPNPTPTPSQSTSPSPSFSPSFSSSTALSSAAGTTHALLEKSTSSPIQTSQTSQTSTQAISSSSHSLPTSSVASISAEDVPLTNPSQLPPEEFDNEVDPGPGIAIVLGSAGAFGALAGAAGIAALVAKKRKQGAYELPNVAHNGQTQTLQPVVVEANEAPQNEARQPAPQPTTPGVAEIAI